MALTASACGDDGSTPPQPDASEAPDAPPPELSIAEARAADNDTLVTVEGVVTVAPGTFNSSTDEFGFAIQDDSGGVYVTTDDDTLAFGLNAEVRVTGTVGDMNEMRAITLTEVEVLAEDATPVDPTTVTTASVGEEVEGTLVQVSGTVTQAAMADETAGITLLIDDDSGGVQVYVHLDGDGNGVIVTSDIAIDGTLTVIGLAMRAGTTYMVAPRQDTDRVDYMAPAAAQ